MKAQEKKENFQSVFLLIIPSISSIDIRVVRKCESWSDYAWIHTTCSNCWKRLKKWLFRCTEIWDFNWAFLQCASNYRFFTSQNSKIRPLENSFTGEIRTTNDLSFLLGKEESELKCMRWCAKQQILPLSHFGVSRILRDYSVRCW